MLPGNIFYKRRAGGLTVWLLFLRVVRFLFCGVYFLAILIRKHFCLLHFFHKSNRFWKKVFFWLDFLINELKIILSEEGIFAQIERLHPVYVIHEMLYGIGSISNWIQSHITANFASVANGQIITSNILLCASFQLRLLHSAPSEC